MEIENSKNDVNKTINVFVSQFWKNYNKLILILFGLCLCLFILDRIFPPAKIKPYSKLIYAKDGTLLTGYLSQDDKWRMKCSIDEVSPDLLNAILSKEDKWFYWHWGVNPIAVIRAGISNLLTGRRVSGASTITMQVVRILEPANRTYLQKIYEMFRAVQLEFHYSKKEILEMYLSVLPYGGNIEGVKAASYIYFNRPPSRLSLAQSILLAVIPNNPNAMRLDKSVEYSRSVRNYWVKKFERTNVFSKGASEDAYTEPLLSNRYPVSVTAPQFCYYVGKNFQGDNIYTNLDLNIQRIAENLLSNHVSRVTSEGVSNGAIIVVDNRTSSVVAYCGSADFYNNDVSGQVDGVRAVRSPGSTLKAGLYTLAFDLGILTPKMKLLDIPTDFGGYEPENYTEDYEGDVSAEYALVNSLNIPAVRLLQEVGLSQYVTLLDKAGFREIAKSRDKLGLSMILGGCGVTLEELVTYFTSFARKGKLFPLNYISKENPHSAPFKKWNKINVLNNQNGIQIFSPEAVYITAQILSSNERPDFPDELLNASRLPRIAWKTGTSFGKKDAWAIGFSTNYTIGVWMGNFDGKGSPHLSGGEMAVPLLFDLFNSIDYNSEKQWFSQPANVSKREVCEETGLLPSLNCTNLVSDYYIKNISTKKICRLYKEIYTNEDETIQYCTECLPETGYKKILIPEYEPELALWYENNNMPFKKAPPHNPDCQAKFSDEGPKIISPSQNYEYFIEEKTNQQILLQAASSADNNTLYWYINEKFYKSCTPNEKVFFRPGKGITSISCLDDKGRKSSITINVKFY